MWFQVFQKATLVEDANIINITLKQIRNKTCSTTGVYSNEALKCVGVLIGRESVCLPGKIPGAFHSKFSTINNTAYVLHGFEYLREEPAAKLGSLWKHKVSHVSKNYIRQLNICRKNLSNMVQVNFPVWGTKKSCNSLESKTESAFGPVLAFSVAGQSLLFQ